MAFLPAEAFHFRHGHALDAELGERFFDFLEFERLDDRFEFFHGKLSVWRCAEFHVIGVGNRGTRCLSNRARGTRNLQFVARDMSHVKRARHGCRFVAAASARVYTAVDAR